MHYVYVLQNVADARDFYIGYTSDLVQRLSAHNSNRNPSTKGKNWRLLYYEAYVKKSVARDRERTLKAHGRSKQLLLERVSK